MNYKKILMISVFTALVLTATFQIMDAYSEGTVVGVQRISYMHGNLSFYPSEQDWFGSSVADLGDLDGDGIPDLAVGVKGGNHSDSSITGQLGEIWILFLNDDGTVKSGQLINSVDGGFGVTLNQMDHFGASMANLGDLDGDGVTDLAVGAEYDDDGGDNRGAVYILFLNTDGTVKSHQKISDIYGGFAGGLADNDRFGSSVASIGDLNGDSTAEIAVGVSGAVYILFLNTNGTVQLEQKISDTEGGFGGTIADGDRFGSSVAGIGDLNGDGVLDLAVGAPYDQDGGSKRGAIWILFLDSFGMVQSEQKISDTQGGFNGVLDNLDDFGSSIANIEDLDGDGIIELAVGAPRDDDGGNPYSPDQGAVWLLYMNSDGTVKSEKKISNTEGNFMAAGGGNHYQSNFGSSVVNVGDIDGDGASDLAVGVPNDRIRRNDVECEIWPGCPFGALWIIFMEPDDPPILSVPDDLTVEATGSAGAIVTFNVFAVDDVDAAGTLPVSCSYASGSTFPLGVTTVMCSATDSVGNIGMASFNINVVDTTPPQITQITGVDGEGVSIFSDYDLSYSDSISFTFSATDIVTAPGAIMYECSLDGGAFSPCANPHQLSGLSDGEHTLVVKAFDEAGNESSPRSLTWIIDTTPPIQPTTITVIKEVIGGGPLGADDFTLLLNRNNESYLLVGAPRDDDGSWGTDRGAAWRLIVDESGNVTSEQKISDTEGNFDGILDPGDNFSDSVANVGDIDLDGITDLAVGAPRDNDGNNNSGAVWILLMNNDGTVKLEQKISDTEGNFDGSLGYYCYFGSSVAGIGDLNGDGIPDLAVGAESDDADGLNKGALWILFMNTNGKVKSEQKISDTEGNFGGVLNNHDSFGSSITNMGDLDGDGYPDLAVGAEGDDGDGVNRGAVWILFMNSDGTVKSEQKISDTDGGFGGVLDDNDFFGSSVANIGDLDKDGIKDLSVGLPRDDDGGTDRGAVWILFMNSDGAVKSAQKISDTEGGFDGVLDDRDYFGSALANVGDLNKDGVKDFAVGATNDDDGAPNKGAVWILFMNSDGTVKSTQKISDTEGGFSGVLDGADFFGASITIINNEVLNGEPNLVIPGMTYTIGEVLIEDYDVSFSGDCSADGVITVTEGQAAVCTITNTYNPIDVTPPTFDATPDIIAEATGSDGAVVTFTVTVSDDLDPEPSVVCVPPSGSTFSLGTTTVTCTATDTSSNSSSMTFDVIVQDTTPPVLTIPSDQIVEAIGPSGTVVVFSVTATDIVDSAPSVMCVPPSGSTFSLGTTTVTCTATDASGNSSSGNFSVIVQDTTPPVLTPPGNITKEGNTIGGATGVDLGTATVSDIVDPSPDLSNDASSIFLLGQTIVIWTATDFSGNSVTAIQSVTVLDTTPPDLVAPSDITVEANGNPKSSVLLDTVVAIDLVDGEVVATNDAPVDGFPLGTTVVTWTAIDSVGNTASATQQVTVVDTTPPALTVPADISVIASGPQTAVNIGTAIAEDLFGPVNISNDAPSTFPVGETIVTWTANDANGNATSSTQRVVVRYLFGGFLPPLANGGIYKQGRTIPVKIRVLYEDGSLVTGLAPILTLQLLISGELSGESLDVQSSGAADPGNTFRLAGDQYIYNLDTRSVPSGMYRLMVDLQDGSGPIHLIDIVLK